MQEWADTDLARAARTVNGPEPFYLPDFFIREETKTFCPSCGGRSEPSSRFGSATRRPIGKLRNGRWSWWARSFAATGGRWA